MTKNQIDYWRLQEEKRSNAVVQAETARHNLANERETARSNVARETETSRSNLANESEMRRSNVARETETSKHNRATESVDLGKLNESVRHNQATEFETNRHNVRTENESERSNRAREQIDLGHLNETARHNRATEGLSYAQLSEQATHNRASERIGMANVNLGYSNLEEQATHNRAIETVQRYSAISQGELNDARTALTEAEQSWNAIMNSNALELTDVQQREIQARIDKLSHETEKLGKDLSWYTYNEVMKGVDTLSRLFSSMDDLQRAIEGYGSSPSNNSRKYDKYLDNLLKEIRNED